MLGNSDASQRVARISRWTMWVLGAGALFYLLTEHRAHSFDWLPFLILLACPLMHVFMHHGHHHRGSPPDPTANGEGKNPESTHKHH